MHLKQSRQFWGIGAIAISVLMIGGCSGDADKNDAGVKPPGERDTGVHPDATTNPNADAGPDGGMMMPDSGPQGPCPPNTEGCRCTPDTADAGPTMGTCGPGLICQAWSDTLATCIRECMDDGACTASRFPNAICRGGLCVQEERPDDEACRLHALGGRTVAGCRQAADCTIFADSPPGEGVCLQYCTPTPADPTGGCSAEFPYCNPRVLSRGGNPVGVCSKKKIPVGARCRGGATFTQRCDTSSTAGDIFCLSNDIVQVFGGLPMDEGFCIEGCDPGMPIMGQCGATRDPSHTTTCADLGVSMMQRVGLCSHGCDSLLSGGFHTPNDNNCTIPGSLNAGARCIEFSLTVDRMSFGEIGLCTDVQTPTVAEGKYTNVNSRPRPAMGTTPPSCVGTGDDPLIYNCEHGSECLNLGTSMNPVGGCVRMCTATASVAPWPANECAGSRQMNSHCIRLANTGTTSNSGFCSSAP
jgi:hypothetical protein